MANNQIEFKNNIPENDQDNLPQIVTDDEADDSMHLLLMSSDSCHESSSDDALESDDEDEDQHTTAQEEEEKSLTDQQDDFKTVCNDLQSQSDESHFKDDSHFSSECITNATDGLNDENQQIVDASERVTFNVLTLYEKILLLGIRALQIANGSQALVDTTQLQEVNEHTIAALELEQHKIPFLLKRVLPNGKIELWHTHELVDVNVRTKTYASLYEQKL